MAASHEPASYEPLAHPFPPVRRRRCGGYDAVASCPMEAISVVDTETGEIGEP